MQKHFHSLEHQHDGTKTTGFQITPSLITSFEVSEHLRRLISKLAE